MPLPLVIAWRYLLSKKDSGFITFISVFAIVAMALGVFSLIVVLSVMNGFDYELKSRLLRAIPHAYVIPQDNLDATWPEFVERVEETPIYKDERLLGISPYIESIALLRGRGSPRPVTLRGVDLQSFGSVSVIGDSLRVGSLSSLDDARYQIAMGALLARQLGLTIGDKVTVTLPIVNVTPAGVFPRSKRFTVSALFETGSQADQSLAFISLPDAQTLYRKGQSIDGFTLKFDDLYKSQSYLELLDQQLLDSFGARTELETIDWSETQGSLFQAVKMEKVVIGILLSIIIAVAAFNIVTSLIMMVTEKRAQIAVLRTMGFSRRSVFSVFALQGGITALIGILVGAVLGVSVAKNVPFISATIEKVFGVQLFDPSVYFVAYLPSQWQLDDTLIVVCGALITSALATLYPAYRATEIKPVEALNYY